MPAVGEVRSAHRYFNGRLRAEAHHPADDVARFEREAHARQFLGQFLAQPFLQILDADPGAALELHLQHRFLRARTPEIDGIDGVIGRLRADKAEADFHVICTDLALDRIECLQRDLLGALDTRSCWSPQVQLELSGIDKWENLGSEPATDQENNCATNDEVGKYDDTPSFHDEVRQPLVLATQPVKKGRSRLAVRAGHAQHPDR